MAIVEIIPWLKGKLNRRLPRRQTAMFVGTVVTVAILLGVGASIRDAKDLWEGIKDIWNLVSGLYKHPIWCFIALIIGAAVLAIYTYGRGRTIGESCGIIQGKKIGKDEITEARYNLGLQDGILLGKKEEREYSQTILFTPVHEAFANIKQELDTHGLGEHVPALVKAYAGVIIEWNKLVVEADRRKENPTEELRLATQILKNYLEQLPKQKSPSSRRLFLPANFEVYAECVANVLEMVANHRPERPGTIQIWTHLQKPIERWYNIAEGHSTNGLEYAHSYDWWEAYKERVRKLRGGVHNVQMRRVVYLPKVEDQPDKLAVFVPLSDEMLTILAATRIQHKIISNGCPTLLPKIKQALTFSGDRARYPLHLIGKCGCPIGTHSDWDQLKHHFDNKYHNGVIPDSQITCGAETKGVFCVYAIPTKTPEYDDVFLVDMRPVGAGLFGIAYYKDLVNDLNGIVFLTDKEICDQIKTLNDTWIQAESVTQL